MTKWKHINDIPIDDKSYLVSWRDWEGKYSYPIRAYYVLEENSFFACECEFSFPLKVDIYIEMPEVPNS